MYNWLLNQIDIFSENITSSLVSCVIAIAIIIVITMFLRRFNKRKLNANKKKALPRLIICDTIEVDHARRLILIRRDNIEHLILIGGTTDIVIESNIIETYITPQNTYQQKKDTQSTSTTNPPVNLAKKMSFPVNETKCTQENVSKSFIGSKNLEDAAIIAEIEGRQEPSLFIPSQKK